MKGNSILSKRTRTEQQQRYVNVPPSKKRLEIPPTCNDLVIGKPPSYMKNKEIAIEDMVQKLDVRLTEAELGMLRQKLDRNKNGIVSKAELAYAGHKARDERSARELCLSVV